MIAAKYQTIGLYLQEKRRRHKRNSALCLFIGGLCAVLGFIGATQHEQIEKFRANLTGKKKPVPWTGDYTSASHRFFAIPPGYSCFQNDSKSLSGDFSNQIPLDAWKSQLPAARTAWAKVLPGVKIPNPEIKAGTCGLSAIAIACTDRLSGAITIAMSGNNLADKDRHTVLMHELGHLLGVPHIDWDPLMNTDHNWNVDAPTPAAVALAKLANRKGTGRGH
jgi:hypothetical protein